MQASVFNRYLAHMQWSRQPVQSWGDLSTLLLPNYGARMEALVANATLWRQPVNSRSVAASEKSKVFTAWKLPVSFFSELFGILFIKMKF